MTATTTTVTTAPSRPFALLFYFVGAYAWTWAFDLVKILAQRDIVSGPCPFSSWISRRASDRS